MSVLRRRWRTVGTAAVASLALVATGCGSGQRSSGGSEASGEAVTQMADESGTPKRGGNVIMALEASTTGGFCIAEAQLAVSGIQIASALYDPLFAFNERREPTPYLAESYQMSADGRTHTIKLRSGIKFSDGSPLDSSIVKLNIDTWRGNKDATTETGRSPLLFVFVFSNIEKVEAPDASTVVITSKTPWKALPNLLSSGRFGIMAASQLKASKADCAAKPVGSGPFMADGTLDLSEGADVKLVRNPNYWRTDKDGNQLPYLDGITFRPIVDSGKRAEALNAQSGGVDIIHTGDGPSMQEMQAKAKRGEMKYVREGEDYAEVAYMMFNQSKPPFNDKRARMAVAYGVNVDALNKIVNNGEFPITKGPFGPGVIGYLANPKNAPVYDIEKAKAMVAELGGKLEFTFTYTPGVQKIADEVKRQLEQVPGVKVNLETKLQSALIDTAIRGDFQSMSWRNHAGADPDTQYNWWRSDSPVNFGKFKDAEIDRLLDEGRASLDDAQRKATYEKLTERFAEEVHNGWTWYSLWGIGARNRVNGALGRTLPNGDKPLGLWVGFIPVTEIWVSQ